LITTDLQSADICGTFAHNHADNVLQLHDITRWI